MFYKISEYSIIVFLVRSIIKSIFLPYIQEHITSAEDNISKGKFLTELDALVVDRDVLKEKLSDLERTVTEYSQKYNERKKRLNKCVDFHKLVQETSMWWMSGLQHIAHMNMEEIQTHDGIERLKTSLQKFIETNPPTTESQIARITELAHHLGSKQVEQAEQVSCRCLEVQEMLQVKQNQILGAEGRFKKVCIAIHISTLSLSLYEGGDNL